MHNKYFIKYSSKCTESAIVPYNRIMRKFVLGYISVCACTENSTCDYKKAFDYSKYYLYWKIYGCTWSDDIQKILYDVDYFMKRMVMIQNE